MKHKSKTSKDTRILVDHEGHLASYTSWLEDLHVVGRLKTVRRAPFFKRHIVIEAVHAFTVYGHRDVAIDTYDIGDHADFIAALQNMKFWDSMQDYYKHSKPWQSYMNDMYQRKLAA